MPTAQQLVALIKSHVRGDDERFHSLALQVAAGEARKGHNAVADQLRELLDESKRLRPRLIKSSGVLPVPLVRSELSGILSVSYPTTHLNQMILSPTLSNQLSEVVFEQRQRAKLGEHGFSPRRKFLLVGPPGSGKTMTAAALAGELGLPLFTVLLHGVITKFMGESAAKLRLVFDAMLEVRGVYLFDEFDALGSKRSSANDVGEARRILNSFLQFLEADGSDAIIVATTNHEDLLDRALFRRFDGIVRYELPSAELIVASMKSRLHSFVSAGIDWRALGERGIGLSQAEVIRAAEDAARGAILANRNFVKQEEISRALDARLGSPE